ncbi:transcriptional repressor LexA [Chitinispirillales bacterium ANBcel5]|uniref:transcriptional repressor LexA n=1 Tax=Cellulosispirillum alkaliphilum TaxID=3039283 RepID=UPI002A503043|nr:transcriptional repressor LexA [Chitinispirillales bacterium ANBcel5]
MSSLLTPEQSRVLSFIIQYRDESGFPPSVREIAQHFGYKSANSVRQHLRLIERKGYIRIITGRARGIEVLENPFCSDELSDEQMVPPDGVPLVGSVAAGKPITAVENLEGYVTLDRTIFRGDDLFALRIRGDSMIDIGVLHNDLVVVRKKNTAENGEVIVAILEGEATLKRFIKKKDCIILRPENPEYEDIVVHQGSDIQIAGKLVGVIRKY